MDRFYRIAHKLSFKSKYHGSNKRMAAVVVKGGSIISAEVNQEHKHAERRAIRPHVNLEGACVYVARSNGLISKPCKECMDVIIASGVSKIVYINATGNLVKEYIRR